MAVVLARARARAVTVAVAVAVQLMLQLAQREVGREAVVLASLALLASRLSAFAGYWG